MRVRMKTCLAGVDFVRNVGDVCEFDDAEAARLVDKGYAEPLGPETASAAPAEKATKPRAAKRVAKASNSADK